MLTRYWTKLVFVVIIASALSVFVWVAIYSAFPYNLYNILVKLFTTAQFYFTVILIQVVCLLPRALYMYIQTNYYPHDADIIRERAVRLKDDVSNLGTDLETITTPPMRQMGTFADHNVPTPYTDAVTPNSKSPLQEHRLEDTGQQEQLQGYEREDFINASTHELVRSECFC